MRWLALAAVAALIALAAPAAACVGLSPPVEEPIVAPFAPSGSYAGHWGVDFGVPEGTAVRAAGPGTVSFSGSVAGMLAVTVDHGGGLKSTVSYLGSVSFGRGSLVGPWSRLGTSALHGGRPAVHFSTRIDGRYVDPQTLLGCAVTAPGGAVRLVPIP